MPSFEGAGESCAIADVLGYLGHVVHTTSSSGMEKFCEDIVKPLGMEFRAASAEQKELISKSSTSQTLLRSLFTHRSHYVALVIIDQHIALPLPHAVYVRSTIYDIPCS